MTKPALCPLCELNPARRGRDTRWCADCFRAEGRPKKRCQQCRESKPADTFARVCKDCQRKRSRERYIESTYGLTPEQYDSLLAFQDGRCAICRNRPRTQRLAVDHDHKCCPGDEINECCARGLLCKRCNKDLLGSAHDSVEILRNAVAYLEHPPMCRMKEDKNA